MNYQLVKLPSDLESEDLSSHFFGDPDIPTSWDDNAIFNNDEVFLAQINLSEVDIPELPKKGILQFFVAVGSLPFRGIVRFFDDFSDVERISFNSEVDYDYNLDLEYELKPSDKDEFVLFGEMPKFKKFHPLSSEVCLLTLDLKNHPEIDLFKNCDEKIAFVIPQEDLKKLDFSKARLALAFE